MGRYALADDLMAQLRPPAVAMPAFGHILDQATDQMVPYDPNRICPRLQNTLLAFLSNPPRDDDGYTQWLLHVGSRQTGKSATAAMGIGNLVEYSPGTLGVIMADKKERATDLFRAIHMNWEYKDERVRYPTAPSREVRQITFDKPHNGKIITLSANEENAGIGRGASFLQLSELPFWNDPGDVWFKLGPAFRNRRNALIVMESTPAPMSEPGAEWYKDMADEAYEGNGRFKFLFVPYFESILNERTWKPDWVPTNDEIRLLERWGPPTGHEPVSAPGAPYLTLENLAFRRTVMVEDKKIRRNPELFYTFYPTDAQSCWEQSGAGAIPMDLLERHEKTAVHEWKEGEVYQEYSQPREDAVYLLAMDPSGYGTGDPAAFTVWEVWADEWIQVAEYETRTHDPPMQAYFAAKAAMKYNDALVVVENNGVGAGPISLLEMATHSDGLDLTDEYGNRVNVHIKNLFYYKRGTLDQRPGVSANRRTIGDAMGRLVDGLRDKFVIKSRRLYRQLKDYRRDKEVEPNEKGKVVDPDKIPKGRRRKHHWDRASSMLWAAWAIPEAMPTRYKPKPPEPDQGPKFDKETGLQVWTYADLQRFREADKRRKASKARSQGLGKGKVKKTKYRGIAYRKKR